MNLQQIPAKGKYANLIRGCFKPREGYAFLDADYSQIELRVLAHISQEPKLIKAFKEGIDLHRLSAAQGLNKKVEDVTDEERAKIGKVFNFGIIYGISQYGMSDLIGTSTMIAEKYILNYLKGYPKVCDFIDQAKSFLDKNGYVPTLYDRKRRIPEVHAVIRYKKDGIECTKPDTYTIGSAKRQGVNAIIQASAGEVMKQAMIDLIPVLKKWNCYLILTIHDELLIEIPKEYASEDSECVKEIISTMENAVELEVPLVADFQISAKWMKG